jgi:hypothetical protein
MKSNNITKDIVLMIVIIAEISILSRSVELDCIQLVQNWTQEFSPPEDKLSLSLSSCNN